MADLTGLAGEHWMSGACARCGGGFIRLLASGICVECDTRAREAEQRLVRAQKSLDRVPTVYRPALEIEPACTWPGEPWSVVFQGANGTGKTWAATRTWALVATTTPGGQWVACQNLVYQLRSRVAKDGGPTVAQLLDTLILCPVLLLDDVQAVRDTEFAQETMRFILCQRYDWQRPTVLTMDQPLSTLEPRLASRLREGWVFKLEGSDRRTRGAL